MIILRRYEWSTIGMTAWDAYCYLLDNGHDWIHYDIVWRRKSDLLTKKVIERVVSLDTGRELERPGPAPSRDMQKVGRINERGIEMVVTRNFQDLWMPPGLLARNADPSTSHEAATHDRRNIWKILLVAYYQHYLEEEVT